MPSEDSDSVRFGRKMGCNSTTSVKAIAMTTFLIGCLGTQPWSVTGKNDIPSWDMHISNQYQGFHIPVTGENPGLPLQKPPWCFFINYSWTPNSYCHGQERIQGLVMGGGFYGECGAPANLGDLGESPQWYLVAKPLVRWRGKAPWSWRIISKWYTNFLIKLISSMVKYSNHVPLQHCLLQGIYNPYDSHMEDMLKNHMAAR